VGARPSRRVDAGSGGRPTAFAKARIELVLYISAVSSHTAAATRNCETVLSRFDQRRVRLEVCDVSKHPDRAESDGVCFTPVLLKKSPLPRAYVVGDLSNTAALVDLLASCGVEPLR
jgi:KaiB domain